MLRQVFKKIWGFLQIENHTEIRKTGFQSPIPFTALKNDALDFCYTEAQTMLASTKLVIDSLNQRAQSYISFNLIGISAIFTLAAFILSGKFSYLFDGTLIFCFFIGASFLLASVGFSFYVLKLSKMSFAGSEPKQLLKKEFFDISSEQLKLLKFVRMRAYQEQIELNKTLLDKKARHLTFAYLLIFFGIGTFVLLIGYLAICFSEQHFLIVCSI